MVGLQVKALLSAHRHRSAVAAMSLVLVLAVAGVGCSSASSPPKATLVATQSRIAPGSSITLTGAVSPAHAGLSVALEVRRGAIFSMTGNAATTDGSGSYTLSFQPTQSGQTSLRVEVLDGSTKIVSPDVQVLALAATSVTAVLSGATEVSVRKATSISGVVTPPVAGRTVTLQTSPDGVTWTPIGTAVSTDSSGEFTLPVQTPTAGAFSIRAMVMAVGIQAAGTSPTVHLYVADYTLAGTTYLACVNDAYATRDLLAAAMDAYDKGHIALTTLKNTDAALAAAYKAQISCLAAYNWPPSVTAWVKDLEAQDVAVAANEMQLAMANSLGAYNTIYAAREASVANTMASKDSANIRQKLGLRTAPASTPAPAMPTTTARPTASPTLPVTGPATAPTVPTANPSEFIAPKVVSAQFMGCTRIAESDGQDAFRWHDAIALSGGQNWKPTYGIYNGSVLDDGNVTNGNGVAFDHITVVDQRGGQHNVYFPNGQYISATFSDYC